MKTVRVFKTVLPLVLGCITTAGLAQNVKKPEKKEEFRVKIVRVENGQTVTLDTVFHSHEEMQNFHKAHMPKDMQPCHKPFNIKIDDEDVEEEIIIKGNDTLIKHRIKIHKIEGDSLADILKMVTGEEMEIIRKHIGDTVSGREMKVVKIIAFINVKIDDPAREELNNNTNPEIKNSVKEKSLTVNNLKVYPNPGSGKLSIEFEITETGTTQLLVTDLQGKEIYKEDFTNNGTGLQTRQLDLSSQPSGFYLLKIKSGDKSVVKKLVIQGGE